MSRVTAVRSRSALSSVSLDRQLSCAAIRAWRGSRRRGAWRCQADRQASSAVSQPPHARRFDFHRGARAGDNTCGAGVKRNRLRAPLGRRRRRRPVAKYASSSDGLSRRGRRGRRAACRPERANGLWLVRPLRNQRPFQIRIPRRISSIAGRQWERVARPSPTAMVGARQVNPKSGVDAAITERFTISAFGMLRVNLSARCQI